MSGADSVIDASRKPFLDVATDISGSLVYLDAGAAEVTQLSLGPAFLLGLGATNVCDLERCQPDDALLPLLACGQAPTSLVVFTTQLLTETHQHVVHLLMVHPHVQRCLLFCSVSELAHAQLDPAISPLGVEAYSDYVAALRQDVAAARAAAGLPVPREDQLQLAVRHLPLHMVAIDSHTFVLPAAGAVASKAVAGGRAAGFGSADAPPDHGADEGAVGGSGGLSLLPHCLADLSRVLGAKLEPFAIGPVSSSIARELAALPQQGHRPGGAADLAGPDSSSTAAAAGAGAAAAAASGSIGLVLIDRCLDLATPCMHAEHVLDAVFASLPRADAVVPAAAAAAGSGAAGQAPRAVLRPADLRVDIPRLAPLAPLTPPQLPPGNPQPTASANQQQPQQQQGSGSSSEPAAAAPAGLAPLCCPLGLSLFHPADRRWLGWLQQLWPKRGKDALLLLRKWLKEALRQERITPGQRSRLSSVVSPAELAGLAQCLMASPEVFLRHTPIVGLALAAAAALATEPPVPSVACTWPAWERLGALERQLLLALPEGSEGAGMLQPMLVEAITSCQQGRLQLGHVLQLLVVVYSLSGDRMPPAPPLYSADEAQLKEALADAMLAAAAAGDAQQQWLVQLECLPAAQHVLHQAVQSGQLSADPAGVRGQLLLVLHDAFQRLRWLAAARGKLRDVRRLMQVDADTGAASACTPLVRQVLTKILLRADNRDLQQPESASLVAGLLSKGLGRLGMFGGMAGPARASISDYQTVLLFVVGGISAAEVREVRAELEEHVYGHKPLVLLGGTSLLSAGDAARLLLS